MQKKHLWSGCIQSPLVGYSEVSILLLRDTRELLAVVGEVAIVVGEVLGAPEIIKADLVREALLPAILDEIERQVADATNCIKRGEVSIH